MISEFRGEFYFLSNFFLCPVEYEGTIFASSEHAYMSAKSHDPIWKAYCSNPNVTPSDVKRESQHIPLIPTWEKVKYSIMEKCVRSKFMMNEELRAKLIATGNQNLQEGNWWEDRTWGVDLKVNPNVGENHLGRILMKVRDELKTIA